MGTVGDQVLYFEDVAEGDKAPERSRVLNRTDLVMYAGASGDYNPMHHDEVTAQAAGQPTVFGHGMFSMGLLGTAITDYVGVGNVRRFRVRFAKQTWPDEDLRTAIVVTGKRTEGRTTWSTSTFVSTTASARRRWSVRPPPCSRAAPDLAVARSSLAG